MTPRLEREAQSAEWVRAIETHGAWVQIWPVDPGRLIAWLRGRARQLGLNCDDAALELIAGRTEGNLLAAHQELGKLALLTGGSAVTAEVVLSSVADSARFDVFQLSEAVLTGSAGRALRVLAGLRGEGTEPTLVLWALTKALHDAWNTIGSSGGGAGRLWGRQGAALEQARRRAPRMRFPDLTERAARADRIIKGRVPGNAWDELTLLTAALCG